MKKSNVIVYVRVSTDEQANQGYSLEHQESAASTYCKVKNYNVLQVFKEDFSAKTFDRPEWNKLMTYIKSNRGLVDRIVFIKWDRFSRNHYEALGVIKKLHKLNMSIECIEQPLDFENPDALLMLSIYLAIPEIENTKIANRTKDGMRQAALNGCWVWKPPFGYERAWVQFDSLRRNATLVPNADEIAVKRIYDYFINFHLSAEGVRKRINEEFGKLFSKQGILDILTNTCYTGKIKIKAYKDSPEIIVNGYHKGIISEETFQLAQDILSGKRRKHVRKDNREQFPLKEVIKCSSCNLSYTASITTKNKGLNKYPYYHCSKTKGHDRFPAHVVHSTFDRLLSDFKVKDEILDLYKKVIIETINSHNTELNIEKDRLEREIEKIRARIRNAENMLADDSSQKELYLSMLKRYNEEENTLIMKHASLKAESMPKKGDIEYLMELFNSFDVLYREANFDLKRQIIRSIFPKPLFFLKDHFRTEEVSPLIELLVLNSNKLRFLKIETSHLKNGSSSVAPQTGLEPVTL